MTLRQLTDLGLKAKLFTFAVTATSILAMAATSARADVSSAGACRFRVHLVLSSGSYLTKGSNVSCTGTLDGQPVQDGGSIEIWGHYIESSSADSGCTVAWRDGVFYARIAESLGFFGPNYVSTEGGFDMSGNPVMQVTGTGDADYKPFIEQGVATFTPDPGQSCGSLHSGVLTQRVRFVDGGTGNPDAEEAVSRYLAQEQGTQSGTGSAPRQEHRNRRYRRAHRHRSHKH